MSNDPESLTHRAAQEQKDAAQAHGGAFKDAENLPRRYKLYDRISEHLSLRGINIVSIVTSLLIVALFIYGILTANPA